MEKARFEWDAHKDAINWETHGVRFADAQYAFADPGRVILADEQHSEGEQRYYCVGRLGDGIITVRFTYRGGVIRIFGAGYWRKGKQHYEKKNQIHG